MTTDFIDISMSLRQKLPVWPGDPEIILEPVSRIANGDPANVTGVNFGTHAGSHIDAPNHFYDDGGTLESIALERLIGPCLVVDFSHLNEDISAEDFSAANIPEGTRRILLKTPNSKLWSTTPDAFSWEYIGITADGAQWLVDREIDFVGIDYLSVEPSDSDGETHRIMLGAGQIILETIDLRHVEPGLYTLYCLPLRIDGADGSPSRAILGPA
jgi:arylformamidase